MAQPFAFVAHANSFAPNEPGSNFITIIDTATNLVVGTIPVEGLLAGIAAAPDGTRVYAAHKNLLTVIDPATKAVTETITIADATASAINLFLSDDGKRLYVGFGFFLAGHAQGSAVVMFDTCALHEGNASAIPVRFDVASGTGPFDVADYVDASRTKVYIGAGGLGDTYVLAYDPVNGPTQPSVDALLFNTTDLTGFAFDGGFARFPAGVEVAGNRLFVPSFGFAGTFPFGLAASSMTVFDAASAAVLDHFLIPCCVDVSNGNQLAPDGKSLYLVRVRDNGFTLARDGFLVVDTSTGAVREVSLPGVGRPAFTPDGSRGYAAVPDATSVVAFDTASGQQIGEPIGVGAFPFAIAIPPPAGEATTCGVDPGQLVVVKQVINNNGGTASAGDFTMTVTGDGAAPGSFAGEELPGTTVMLNEGFYTVSEAGPRGYSATFSPECTGTITAGETKTCVVTNDDIPPQLVVTKQVNPSADSGLFNLLIDGVEWASDVGHDGTTGPVPVAVGLHAVGETAGTGTTLDEYVTAVGGDCTPDGVVGPLALGQSATCVITNVRRGRLQVIKTVAGAPPARDHVFTFQIRQGASTTASGTTLESGTAGAPNGGIFEFSTKLAPGATYQLCEIVMPGWLTSLGTFVPDSFVPPDGLVPNPNVDNSVLCVNLSVSPGVTRAFTVDNTPPPGGRALTIGFWKNWASCASASGSQKPVLDQVLQSTATGIVVSAAVGSYPAFEPLPYLLLHDIDSMPDVASDCQKAVRLLNKSSIDTGKKLASDPMFNLAAQLVAAELNFAAGAGRTPAATTAINQAVLLLGKYKFDGTQQSKPNPADITTMNNLARTLDNYNNNRR